MSISWGQFVWWAGTVSACCSFVCATVNVGMVCYETWIGWTPYKNGRWRKAEAMSAYIGLYFFGIYAAARLLG